MCYLNGMNILVLMFVLLLLFGGGGFYVGGPVIGASGLGLMLVLCLVVYSSGRISFEKLTGNPVARIFKGTADDSPAP